MLSFKDFDNTDGIDYIIFFILEDLIPNEVLINEGRWVFAGVKDFLQRVDAENTNSKQQRHVHIAREKHINAKTKQVSWNQDGLKHDVKNFNRNLGNIKIVKQIARKALNLPPDFILEHYSETKTIKSILCESLSNDLIIPTFLIKI